MARRPEGHPIGVVARRTGLSVHALRAWEQRYGAVAPVRTGGGQRLYTDTDIARLRLLARATELGHPISRIARLDAPALEALLREDRAVAATRGGDADASAYAARVLTEAQNAARALDGHWLHAVLMRAVVQLRADQFVFLVCLPLLQRVGAWWAEGRLRPMEEHVVSVAVRRVLSWLMDQVPPGRDASAIVLTTLQGEHHELGAMLAGVLAAVDGWRPVYLGPNLPPQEVAAAVRRAAAGAVALSMVVVGGSEAEQQLRALTRSVARDVEVIVGGPASGELAAAELGVTRLPDLDRYRELLRTLRAARVPSAEVES